MSREIKFRAFDIKFNRYVSSFETDMIELPGIYLCEQFTGLKDRNGVEIYEGDYVSNNKRATVREVCFSEGSWRLLRVKGRSTIPACISAHFFIDSNYEVIGNIHHENPDPMKEAAK